MHAPALALAALALRGPDALPQDLVQQQRLMTELAALPTARAARGDADSRRGLAATEDHLVDRLTAMGYEPRRLPLSWNLAAERRAQARAGLPVREAAPADLELTEHVWHNIVVELPGVGEQAAEVLIIGAHFDAAPGAPGADDNGTGTVALLELARVLKDRPMSRTVRLVFFNLEEIGLKGSAEYVRSLRPRWDDGHERLIGMVSLEMLGYFTDEPNTQRSPIPPIKDLWDPPTVGDFIALATTRGHAAFARRLEQEMRHAAPGLKTVTPDFIPDWPLCPPDLLRSDHAPFLMTGHPGVMLTDTSNFRNPHYHRPTDTVGTIDTERFTLVVRGIAGAVYALAGPADH
jgi:aminopeptidase YwaD